MIVKESTVKKTCSFYVSSMHFATMILPFANKQMEEQCKIVTFFENNYTTNIELVLSKLTLKEETKKKLMEINWRETKIVEHSQIEKILKGNLFKRSKNIIIINGTDEYINTINNCLELFIEKNQKKISKELIRIMDFYEMRKL